MKIAVKTFKTARPVGNNTIKLIRGDAQRKQNKPCNGLHNDTTDIWHFKKWCFWKNHKRVFNQLNFVSSIVLRVKSRKMITCKDDSEDGKHQNDQRSKEVIERKII